MDHNVDWVFAVTCSVTVYQQPHEAVIYSLYWYEFVRFGHVLSLLEKGFKTQPLL